MPGSARGEAFPEGSHAVADGAFPLDPGTDPTILTVMNDLNDSALRLEEAAMPFIPLSAAPAEGTILDWNAALTRRLRSRGEDAPASTPPALPAAVDVPRIERAFREILLAIGENPDRDGLQDTPRRVAKAYGELFAGLAEDPSRHLATAFEQSTQQAVVVSGIEFHSTCEHHFLPFFGKAHVAYMPSGDRVVGLSKLARTVDVFARRPQLQERLTEQICDALEEHLSPRGVCVVLEAEHLCMRLRGAKKPGAVTRTLGLRGHYRRDVDARREVMSLMDIRQA